MTHLRHAWYVAGFADELAARQLLEAQQRRIGAADFWSLKPVMLAGDAGAVRARRELDALIAAEARVAAEVAAASTTH